VFTMGNTHLQENLPPHSSLSDLQVSKSLQSIVLIERALWLSMLAYLFILYLIYVCKSCTESQKERKRMTQHQMLRW
jgi:hypothetical protein